MLFWYLLHLELLPVSELKSFDSFIITEGRFTETFFLSLIGHNTLSVARRDLYWFQLCASRKESSVVRKVLRVLLTWKMRVKVEDEGVVKRQLSSQLLLNL